MLLGGSDHLSLRVQPWWLRARHRIVSNKNMNMNINNIWPWTASGSCLHLGRNIQVPTVSMDIDGAGHPAAQKIEMGGRGV